MSIAVKLYILISEKLIHYKIKNEFNLLKNRKLSIIIILMVVVVVVVIVDLLRWKYISTIIIIISLTILDNILQW